MMKEEEDIPVPDDYPVRPSVLLRNELQRHNSVKEKKKNCQTVLLCLTYLIFGIGVGLYGPLFPLQADRHAVPSYIYGIVIACNFFAAIMFYPLASKMISEISCKQTICTGLLVTGCCKLLFGTLGMKIHKLAFILLSFAIQTMDGFGIALLIVATYIVLFSEDTDVNNKNASNIWILVCAALGIGVSPIIGEASYKAFGFGVPFYGIGVLTVIVAILLGIFLPEPGFKLTYKEIPIISWMKEKGMLLYSFIIFTTFYYMGFLAVGLEPYLRQFHLNKIFLGMMFSIPTFVCVISAPCWKWITKKKFNSILLACLASILTIGSLVLFVPAPFTPLNKSLVNISVAILLQGLASGGKLTCIILAADRDLKTRKSVNGTEELHLLSLIIPSLCTFGSFAGYFSGSVITGFTVDFFGLAVSSYIIYFLEAISVITAVVFAFKRNYKVQKPGLSPNEDQPILRN